MRPGHWVFKVPDDLDDDLVSPVNCALSEVLYGLHKVGVTLGDTVVIQGVGGLGLYATVIAKEMGAGQVIALDRIVSRLQLAEEFGADKTINVDETSSEERVARVREWTGGNGADVVAELAGAPVVIQEGLDMMRPGGRYLWVGNITPTPAQLIPPTVVRDNKSIFGVVAYERWVIPRALDLLARTQGKYPYGKVLSHKFPLEEIDAAYALASKRDCIRVGLTMLAGRRGPTIFRYSDSSDLLGDVSQYRGPDNHLRYRRSLGEPGDQGYGLGHVFVGYHGGSRLGRGWDRASFHDRSVDFAGDYHTGPDTGVLELCVDELGEVDDPRLGRPVDHSAQQARTDSGQRRHVDDGPLPCLQHDGNHGLGAKDRADKVGVDYPANLFGRSGQQLAMGGAVAGVVDEDVDATEGVEHLPDHAPNGVVVGHVQEKGLGLASGGADLVPYRLDLGGGPAHQNHFSSVPSRHQGGGSTDAASAAGDDADLVPQTHRAPGTVSI